MSKFGRPTARRTPHHPPANIVKNRNSLDNGIPNNTDSHRAYYASGSGTVYPMHKPVHSAQKPIQQLTPEMKAVFRNSQIISTLYDKATYKKPKSTTEIVTASDGIFQVQHYRNYRIVKQINDYGNSFLDPFLKDYQEGITVLHPKIPFEALRIIYSFFFDIFEGKNQTKACSEAMAQVFYSPEGYADYILSLKDEIKQGVIPVDNNWFVYIPLQSITGASVNYSREIELDHKFICAVDIHSHDSMSAFFSGTDDGDEIEPRFYAVLGAMPWGASKSNERCIARLQTKINNKLERQLCSFFFIFDRPLSNNDALTNEQKVIIELAGRQGTTDQEALYIYSQLFGRVETSTQILDRCKLDLSDIIDRDPEKKTAKPARHRTGSNRQTYGRGLSWDEWQKQSGFYDAEEEPPFWSPYFNGKDIIHEEHITMSRTRDQEDIVYQSYMETLDHITNDSSCLSMMNLLKVLENPDYIIKLRDELRENVYVLGRLIEDNKIDGDLLDETWDDIHMNNYQQAEDYIRQYTMENFNF